MITATIGLIAITATLTGKRTHGHISRAALGGFGSSPRVFGRHGAFSRAASIVLSKKWEWLLCFKRIIGFNPRISALSVFAGVGSGD